MPAVAGAVLLAGCTEDAAGTVALNLTVNTIEPGAPGVPVPNAEVCVLDTEDCATTNADGVATLQVPGN